MARNWQHRGLAIAGLSAVTLVALLFMPDQPGRDVGQTLNNSLPISSAQIPDSSAPANTSVTPRRQLPTALSSPSAQLPTATPPSLRGSDADGRIRFDEFGQLVIDHQLRRRFDYLLSAMGEISLEQMRQMLLDELSEELDNDQVAQVLDEFDLYIEYLWAVEALSPEDAVSLHQQLSALEQMQTQLLGEWRAEAWFGEQNRYLQRSLAILEGDLTPGDPEADPWAADIRAATAHHADVALNREYADQGIDHQQRFLERSALYGEQAAERLAILDAQRADWQQRLHAYASERARLMRNMTLTSEHRRTALAHLREQGFSDSEQRRILALQNAGLLDSLSDN